VLPFAEGMNEPTDGLEWRSEQTAVG
jgi:hypothetical protein